MEFHSSHIPPLLRKVLTGTASLSEINLLVRHAHHFAIVRLKQLLGSGRLHLQSFPLSVESTAIDCIAELFERDSDNVFVELEHFFCVEHNLDELTDDDLIAFFRALIFTKLNDGIFSLYRENDPVLSKILRNVKSAIQQNNCFTIVQILGVSVLVYNKQEARRCLPEMPLEKVEHYFNSMIKDVHSIRNYLHVVEQLFSSETEYSASTPLIDLCIAIKRHIIQFQIPVNKLILNDESLFQRDAVMLIDETLLHMRKQLHERYVLKNKLSEEHFTAYVNAISCMVNDTFLLNDGSEKKYGEYLQEQLPALTYEEYRLHHRKQFEYITKLIKKEVRNRLKELL